MTPVPRAEFDSMRGKVCVVTGATSGIGRDTAAALAARGATVLLTGRNAARAHAILAEIEAAKGSGPAYFIPADFSSQASVRQLAEQIRALYPRIDVLINNAGAAFAERRLTVDGLEETFAVNHLAPFLLTQLLRPTLVDSAPARIVTVSSEAHRGLKSLDFDNLQGEKRFTPVRAYSLSKLANVLFTYELARRLEGSGVTATCMHPGVVRTGIWDVSRGILRAIVTVAKPFMLSSARASTALVKLACDPGLAHISGRYFVKAKETPSSPISYDEALAARLWTTSEALLR
jgi:retinol dehydrogenase-14